ncbi:hypothetical protein CDL15_Pgr007332 [Punica granatum]|uniref:Uncharacterized protein n=1 Tax=Punica granatum TaxID=22663 RepID=A0A218X8P4_PUNGR|nr:hypothetical protein CDL15_Pgr007332 [Punica granatum]
MWVTGNVMLYPLGMIGTRSGMDRSGDSSVRLVSILAVASEAMDFVDAFKRKYGLCPTRSNFIFEVFMDAL